jgi:hypothetical protein
MEEQEILARELARQGEEIRELRQELGDVRHVMESLIARVSTSEQDFYEAMSAASRTAAEAMQAWEQLELAAKQRLSKPAEADEPEGVPPPAS